jgi:L-fuculose-phosphate aldolase
VDWRYGLKECELCDNEEWRPGVTCDVPSKEETSGAGKDPEAEAAVSAITEQILRKLNG